MAGPFSEADAMKKPGNWKRLIANLLIIAGVLALLYPLGTWGYTWIVQTRLARQLEAHHPEIQGDASSFFRQADMIVVVPVDASVAPEHDAGREAALRAERSRLVAEFRVAADSFASLVLGQGGLPIGRIVIPKIGVDVVALEGTGTQDLREGPGHWPETPFPGQGGNFVVSGHRTTYGAPFFRLDQLEVGDEIQVLLPYVAATYRVWRSLIVLPDEVDVVAQRGVEEISLTTCHPIYSASHRLVIQAHLTGYRLLNASQAQ